MATGRQDTPMVVAALTALVALLMVTHALAQSSESDDGLSLDQKDQTYEQQCLTKGKVGLCLNDTQCYPNHTMAVGGDIIGSDIRASGTPLEKCGHNLWCCTYPEQAPETKPSPKPPTSTMLPPDGSCFRASDQCLWCVALYREGGDVSRDQRTKNGLYCGGALVGPRVVLTATTCVRAVQQETVRARLPLSDQPNKFYMVVDSVMHPEYNSGNHANDFALMVLNEDVKWTTSLSFTACMEYNAPQGECQIVGFSSNEEIVMSPASVSDGPCRSKRGGGRGVEVACATASHADQCSAFVGTPLLCPITKDGQGGLAIAGVTRMHCLNGKVLLGKVESHSTWLTQQLKILGVEPLLYSP